MSLPSFTIAGTLFDLLGNTSAGEIVGNGLGGATPATVTFTSNVPAGYFVTFDGAAYRVDEVTAEINSDGTITRNGEVVLLLANDDGLSVDGVQWQAHITGMKRFWFNAPTDGGTVDLGSVVPVPGLGVSGVAFSAGELVTLLSDSGSTVRVALDALYSSPTLANGSVTFPKLAAAAVVTASETIAANLNDITIPTSAAVQAAITAATPTDVMEYKGIWNASTNSPTLADGAGNTGDLYRVGTAGTRNLGSGSIVFDVGDYAIYNGATWEKSDTTDAVASVAGLSGAITSAALKTALGMGAFSTADYAAVSGDDRPRVLAAVNAAVAAMTATGKDQTVLIHGPLSFTTGSTKAALGSTADPDNISHPNVGVPLPCNLAHTLHIVYAPGAEITLSSACNNVFYTDKQADYDTFKNVHFYNAWTDAGGSLLEEGHALVGNSLGAYPNGPLRYMNFENIKFFGYTRFRNFNWSASGASGGQMGIVFRGEHNGPLEATQTHTTGIYLEYGDMEGGSGLFHIASVESETEYRPGGCNHWYDDIVVDRWRCVMPSVPTAYIHHSDTGIFLGGTGFGGRAYIGPGYAENMGDDAIECGTFQQLDIVNPVVKNCWFTAILVRQQHAPLDVESQQINITGVRSEVTSALTSATGARPTPIGFLVDDQHLKVSSTGSGGSGTFTVAGFGPTGSIPWNASKATVAAAFVALGCTGTVCTGAATLNVATPSSPMIIHVAGCDSANPITWASSLTGGSLTVSLDASNASLGNVSIRDAVLTLEGQTYTNSLHAGMMVYGLDQAHRKITLDNVRMVLKDYTYDGSVNHDISLLNPGGPYPGWGHTVMKNINVVFEGTCDFTTSGHRGNMSTVSVTGYGTRVDVDGFTENRSGALDGSMYMVSAGLAGSLAAGSNARISLKGLYPSSLGATTYNAGVGLFGDVTVDQIDVFESDFSKGTSSVTEAIDVGSAGANLAVLRKGRNIYPEGPDLAVATDTHNATGKTTPVDADELPLVDSAASNVLKKLTWANLKATLKTYFDTLYYLVGGTDVSVADGGTGRSTGTTAYSLVATGTTATGAQQTLANGATTAVLVGGGASALPVWTAATGTGAPVRAASPTLSGTVSGGNLQPNSVSVAIQSLSWWNGTDYTYLDPSPNAGAQTWVLPAGAGGLLAPAASLIRLDADYTLPNDTNLNKLFNSPTNGRLTLPTGTYRFRSIFSLSAMSATSGNAQFDFLGAGTAVIQSPIMRYAGNDAATAGIAAMQGGLVTATATPASMFTGATNTAMQVLIEGSFEVTTAGTIIPSVKLATASAVIAVSGSFFECTRVGAVNLVSVGAWD